MPGRCGRPTWLRQARLRAFSLSRRLEPVGSRLVPGDALQSIVDRSPLVVLSLVTNVSTDPLQILGAETDNAIAGLPLKDLLPFAYLLVDVVRRTAFELADPLADG